MDDFILRVILSFFVAGIWVTFSTVLSERFGTKIGGLIGNLPSNILVSMFFIGLTQSPEFAANTAKLVPLGMINSSIFLFIFIILAKKYGKISFLLALAVWFVIAFILGSLAYEDYIVSSIACVLVGIVLFYLLESKFNIPSVEKKNSQTYSFNELLLRAILSGGLVSSVVIIAALFGHVWGGIFATFPAVMTSTMYILYRSQGIEFARATGKVMILGSINIVVFAIAIILTFPAYGFVIGTVISYAAALASVLLLYPLMGKIK